MDAMIAAQGLGWSLNPVRLVKRAASGVAAGAKAVGRGVVKVAPTVAKVALAPAYLTHKLTMEAVNRGALNPIRARLNTITSRRANKLAWDRRKAKTANSTEYQEARGWTKAKMNAKGPHGRLIAFLAGAASPGAMAGLGDFGAVPVAAIVAAAPAIIALLNQTIQTFQRSGEAPADPAAAEVPPPAAAIGPSAAEQAMVEAAIAPPTYTPEMVDPTSEIPMDPGPEPLPADTSGLGEGGINTTALVGFGLSGLMLVGGAYLAYSGRHGVFHGASRRKRRRRR